LSLFGIYKTNINRRKEANHLRLTKIIGHDNSNFTLTTHRVKCDE